MLDQMMFDFVERSAAVDDSAQLAARYLDGVGSFLPSSAAGFYVLDPFGRAAAEVAARGVSDFFLARYEQAGRHRDPVLARAMREQRAVHNGELSSAEEWTASELYREVLDLHDMVHVLEAPVIAGGAVLGTLNFGRTSAEPPFTATERTTAEAVGRLYGIALEAIRRRSGLARERDALVAAIDLADAPLIVTDLQRGQRRLSTAARRLLESLRDPRRLDELLDAAEAHPGTRVELRDGTAARLRARSAPGRDRLEIRVSFLSLHDTARVDVVLPGVELTEREHQVAELAVRGLRDREIADRLCLSRWTVKGYLQTIYRKTGVRSRVELAAGAARPPRP